MPIEFSNPNPSDLNAVMHTLVNSLEHNRSLNQAMLHANLTGGKEGLKEFIADFMTLAQGNDQAVHDINKLKVLLGKVKKEENLDSGLMHLVETSSQIFKQTYMPGEISTEVLEKKKANAKEAQKSIDDAVVQKRAEIALESFRQGIKSTKLPPDLRRIQAEREKREEGMNPKNKNYLE